MAQPNRFNPYSAALWASACVIAALIIVQAGRLPGHPAYADTSGKAGSYTLMTADAGRGSDEDPDEVLYVIDNRDQVLLIYEIEDASKRQIILRDGGSLDQLFRIAR